MKVIFKDESQGFVSMMEQLRPGDTIISRSDTPAKITYISTGVADSDVNQVTTPADTTVNANIMLKFRIDEASSPVSLSICRG